MVGVNTNSWYFLEFCEAWKVAKNKAFIVIGGDGTRSRAAIALIAVAGQAGFCGATDAARSSGSPNDRRTDTERNGRVDRVGQWRIDSTISYAYHDVDMAKTIKLPRCRCDKCRHEWTPRTNQIPLKCPKCGKLNPVRVR